MSFNLRLMAIACRSGSSAWSKRPALAKVARRLCREPPLAFAYNEATATRRNPRSDDRIATPVTTVAVPATPPTRPFAADLAWSPRLPAPGSVGVRGSRSRQVINNQLVPLSFVCLNGRSALLGRPNSPEYVRDRRSPVDKFSRCEWAFPGAVQARRGRSVMHCEFTRLEPNSRQGTRHHP